MSKGSSATLKYVDSSPEIAFRARRRLRRIKKAGKAGVLLVAEIREPVRSLTFKAGVVSVRKGPVELCFASSVSRRPKFVELAPGLHSLDFRVLRMRGSRSSSITEAVELRAGDVIVVLCDPVQANVFYRRSPELDTWVVGGCLTLELNSVALAP